MGPLDMDLSGTRVMIVEDDGMIAMLLRSMLAALKCEVVGIAGRVTDALEKIRALSFDLVLLDVNLAGTMSYPVADMLSERGIPFIFITSYGRAALPPKMHMAPVLSKPFDLPRLSAALVALLHGEPEN